MKKITLILLIIIGCRLTAFGQDSSNNKAFDMFQGAEVYEDGMMQMLTGLRDQVWEQGIDFITDAKALSAIFMIVFFAIKSYEMMAGDRQLEIMPLLRPFGLSMIILWWNFFVQMIAFPCELVENQAKDKWKAAQIEANNLRIKRAGLMKEMADRLYNFQAQVSVAEKRRVQVFSDVFRPTVL